MKKILVTFIISHFFLLMPAMANEPSIELDQQKIISLKMALNSDFSYFVPGDWWYRLEEYQDTTNYYYSIWQRMANNYLGKVSYNENTMNTELFGGLLSHHIKFQHHADELKLSVYELPFHIKQVRSAFIDLFKHSAQLIRLNAAMFEFGLLERDESMNKSTYLVLNMARRYNVDVNDVVKFILYLGKYGQQTQGDEYLYSYGDLLQESSLTEQDMLVALALLRNSEFTDAIRSDLRIYK